MYLFCLRSNIKLRESFRLSPEFQTAVPSALSNMPSLSERISKYLVQEIGAEDLRPIRSLESANEYSVLSILWKKRTRSGFWESPDVPVEYTLTDFLEPGSSVPGTVNKGKGGKEWKTRVLTGIAARKGP